MNKKYFKRGDIVVRTKFPDDGFYEVTKCYLNESKIEYIQKNKEDKFFWTLFVDNRDIRFPTDKEIINFLSFKLKSDLIESFEENL